MTRRTIIVDGAPYCADVTGTLPGNMTIANAVAGACVTTPPGIEPPGRMRSGTILYPNLGVGNGVSNYPRRVGPLLTFADVFGDGDPRSGPSNAAFPGAPCAIWINAVPAGGYVALEFSIADLLDGVTLGASTYGNELSALVEASVGANPGDFNPATCIGSNTASPGGGLLKIVTKPHTNGVAVDLNARYFLNLRHHGTAPHVIALNSSPTRQAH